MDYVHCLCRAYALLSHSLATLHHFLLHPFLITRTCPVCRLLSAYNARIADEGEYDEEELPTSVVDDLEGAAGPARQAFAVRPTVATSLITLPPPP